MGQKLSALTFAPDLDASDLFYMAEHLGGGIFFERKVELSQLDSRWVNTSGDDMTGALGLPDGTAAAPSLQFTDEPTSGIFRSAAGEIGASILGTHTAEFYSGGLNLGIFALSFSFGFGSAPDVFLFRDGANNLAQRNGVNGQQYHLYNTYTDGANFERLNLEWNSNSAFLSTEQLGTGSFRNLALGSEGDATVSLRTNATNWFTVLGTGSMTGILGIKTANTPILDLSQTWNNAAVTFTAFKQNITNTNSAAGSLLIDMQVSSVTVWSLGKTGVMNLADNVRQTFNPGAAAAGFNFGSIAADPGILVDGDSWYNSTANVLRFRINGATVSFSSASVPPFTDTNTLIKGSADATKLMRFEVDGFTTGTTRILTPQNSDYIIAGTNIANTFSATQTFNAITMTAASLLSITSGANQRAGNAVLVAGTVTVSNTTVTANTIVMLTRKTSGGTIGTAITYTVSAGNSFTITSDSVLDTSTFSYLLIEVP